MKKYPSLINDGISIGLLSLFCLFGFFSISQSLFFIASEVLIAVIALATFYYRTSEFHRTVLMIGPGLTILAIAFLFAYYASVFTGDYQQLTDTYRSPSLPNYMLQMFIYTSPLLAVSSFLSWLRNHKISDKAREGRLFDKLIIALFSIMGIGAFCMGLENLTNNEKVEFTLIAIIFSRILVALYTHKKDIRTILNGRN